MDPSTLNEENNSEIQENIKTATLNVSCTGSKIIEENEVDQQCEKVPKIGDEICIKSYVKRKRSEEKEVIEPCNKVLKVKDKTDVSTDTLILNSVNEEEKSKKVVVSTNEVASHYNAIEEKGLDQRKESRIINMRNFNNVIKGLLIDEYVKIIKRKKWRDIDEQRGNHERSPSHNSPPEIKALDLCCGKGGDLFKWKKAGITYLVCADIAEISVDQCQSRYRNIRFDKRSSKFDAEFLTYDCTKVCLREKFQDPNLQLDIVSCQFALHYCFESLPQAECMLENASKSLKPGGYFIGTIPNANELIVRWRKADGDKIGNDVYNVEFECDKTKPELFGAKYNFYLEGVVNCPEFLVNFPLLCKLALKYNLDLIKFESFQDFYEKRKEGSGRVLAKLIADPLCQSLWEVITLYSVFVFQKRTLDDKLDDKDE